MDLTREYWVVCKEDERYMISTFGRVRGMRTDFLKPFYSKSNGCENKYASVKLGRYKDYRIHRLMGNNFLPNPNNYPEIDHIDRNSQNNHISNLRWVSRSENQINKNLPCNNTSGIKNIYYMKRHGNDRWFCIVQRDKKRIQSPSFITKEEAIQWRNEFLQPINPPE
jgi:hypothetical protein